MTLDAEFNAEFVDAEYLDAEYARYMRAGATPRSRRMDWSFWGALFVLAATVYAAAFLLQARRATPVAGPAPTMDLHDCTLPEVKVELARPDGAEHDMVAPYAHSTCREGDVRLWESLR